MSAVEIIEVTEVSDELVAAMARLVPHLSKSSPPPDRGHLEAIVASPACCLLVARLASDGETTGEIVGTLTLVMFPIPTAWRAWIEDVIVDEAAEGRGIGTSLTNAALDRARAVGVRTVDLTSRPSREAANHMYQRIGFQLRETNVYRLDLD